MSLKSSDSSILYKALNLYKVSIVMFLPASIFWRCRQLEYPFSSVPSSVQPLSLRISRSLRPRRFKKIISGLLCFIDYNVSVAPPIGSTPDSMYLVN